jgi:hypothetical protein
MDDVLEAIKQALSNDGKERFEDIGLASDAGNVLGFVYGGFEYFLTVEGA